MSKLQQAWDDNVKDLKRKNLQMEKDNRNLLAVLSDQAEHSIKEAEFFKNVEEMNLLNEKLEKLTHKNQCKDRLIKEHIDNCNALQSQNESLAKINKDLHQKITLQTNFSLFLKNISFTKCSPCSMKYFVNEMFLGNRLKLVCRVIFLKIFFIKRLNEFLILGIIELISPFPKLDIF